jgi:hypothetical protein
LTELAAPVAEAFAKDEIGVGHALLLAKLQSSKVQLGLFAPQMGCAARFRKPNCQSFT